MCVKRLGDPIKSFIKIPLSQNLHRWSVERFLKKWETKPATLNCTFRFTPSGFKKRPLFYRASSRSTRVPACWASSSPGSCWGRPPASCCRCRGRCSVPWRPWRRRATLPREHFTSTPRSLLHSLICTHVMSELGSGRVGGLSTAVSGPAADGNVFKWAITDRKDVLGWDSCHPVCTSRHRDVVVMRRIRDRMG